MKHATEKALANIEPLLHEIRAIPDRKERKTGCFYRKTRAFLHFHEDGEKMFADVRLQEPDFERLPATTRAEQRRLVSAVRKVLAGEALIRPAH